MSPLAALGVALGAGLGSALRFVAARRLDGTWPGGTLAANVVGATAVGALAAAGLAGDAWAALGIGVCGGMTTWSGFVVQVHDLGWWRGSVYAAVTLALATAGCAVGYWATAL